MGGVVARALFTLPRFNPRLVSLIVTQASPHVAPVLALDPYLLGESSRSGPSGRDVSRHGNPLFPFRRVLRGGQAEVVDAGAEAQERHCSVGGRRLP